MWNAKPIDVPHDGTCMFHAIGLPLKINGHYLREIVCKYISKYSKNLLHDQPLENWIEWDEGLSTKEYVEQLRKGKWGGSIETTILSSLLKTPIFVYEQKNGYCKKISESRPDLSFKVSLSANIMKEKKMPFICLLYIPNNHYMYLKIMGNYNEKHLSF